MHVVRFATRGHGMEAATSARGALAEAVGFLSYFRDLKDSRQPGKVSYPLDEILLLCLLAVLAGAETIVDIALFGQKKLALLRRFRPFAAGTPAHDHLGDILATLDTGQFQTCFAAWVSALTGIPDGGDRDRRQDLTAVQEQRACCNPHGIGLRCAPAPGSGTGPGGREVQ